ncbi:MAG TPA: RNA-binding protein [Chitinophagaceae bacterium]
MNIYVSNLSISVEAEDLKKKFAPYGEVSLINIISDKFTNRNKGFAFVGMRDQSAAEKAIRELDGCMMDGRSIKVKEAQARDSDSKKKYY